MIHGAAAQVAPVPQLMPALVSAVATTRCTYSVPTSRMEYVMSKRCKACGQTFRPYPHVPAQNYCSNPGCQRERRRRWQRQKRGQDPDYRANDADYIKAWAAKHPDYWKRYRQQHPEYAARNRSLQRQRNQRQREVKVANVDALTLTPRLPAGRYRLISLSADGIAKGDAWIVEIAVLSVISAGSLPFVAK